MRAIVLSVGSELLRGDIVDTNATFLTRHLSELGVNVVGVEEVGDDLDQLRVVIAEALDRADIVVSTGGLGPTEDDLTREAIAAAIDEELFVDQVLIADIESRFASLRRRMPKSNFKQAMRIPSAESIPNPHGTAPGWHVRKGGRILVAMPGPPREMQPMWTSSVSPRIAELVPEGRAAISLMTFGLGESMLEGMIADVIHWQDDVVVATYAKTTGVEVHVTAYASDQSRAEGLRDEAETMLRERLGDNIFGSGGDTLAEAIAAILSGSGRRLAVMESATGGQLADLITNNPGSSDYFAGGIVAYSRAVKEQFGVAPAVIDQFGMISGETACAMAEAIRDLLGADIGLSTTGIAGTEPVENHPPGTCFVAVSMDGMRQVREVHRPAERDIAKRFFSQCALDLMRRQFVGSRAVAGLT